MPEFRKYFRTNILMNAISGLPSPDLPPELSQYNGLFRIHFVLSLFGHLNTVVCAIALLFQFRPANVTVQAVSRFGMDFEVFFHTIYYLYNRERIAGIIRKIDDLVEAFQTDPLTRKRDFTAFIDSRYVIIRYYTQGAFAVVSVLATIYAIPRIAHYFGMFGLDGKAVFIYEVPYEADYSPMFEVTLAIQIYVLTFSCLKHIANEAFFLSMFALQTALYDHLREIFPYVFIPDDGYDSTENDNDFMKREHMARFIANKEYTSNDKKINAWIKFHQQALSIGNDLVRLYAPILLVYFCLIYTVITTVILSLTVYKSNYAIEDMVIGMVYWCIILLNLLLLCIYGTNMADQGTNVAQLGFASPWYNCSPRMKNSAKVIFERVRLVLKPSAFGLFNYELSIDSFVTVLGSRPVAASHGATRTISRPVYQSVLQM